MAKSRVHVREHYRDAPDVRKRERASKKQDKLLKKMREGTVVSAYEKMMKIARKKKK